MAPTRPFRAFVSYSHADAKFAAWLQRRLEAYRLPRRLAAQVVPLEGQSPGRIGPVFRDRADLSAATDLSAAVRSGIAASSALIVVASPDAAASAWVTREIGLFRNLHPQAPVLVALVRGDAGEAIPEALRRSDLEPLCADFRRHGDGRRLAFLKIAAGLAGLPLDALVQRDAQRQLRRVTAITGAAGVLLVAMALLLVMALEARREADRRRAAAEGLVQYMVTGLRDRLKRTGDLKVMSSVNDRAVRFLDEEGPAAALPDGSKLLRATILHAVGEDAATTGSLAAAEARIMEAYRTTSAVLARRPDDGDALYAHAQSEFWAGYMGWQKEELPRARRHWQAYLETARRLARAEPGGTRALMELGYSHGNLCELYMRERIEGRVALSYCRAALRFERLALAREPGDNSNIQMAMANRIGWLADALTKLRVFDEARALRLQEEQIYRTLHAREPGSVQLRDRLTWPQIGLAKIEIAEGGVRQGVARLQRSLIELDRLSEALPDNEIVVGERVRVNILIAQALRDSGRRHWRLFRDRAADLLERDSPRGGASGLSRYRRMLERLDSGPAPTPTA